MPARPATTTAASSWVAWCVAGRGEACPLDRGPSRRPVGARLWPGVSRRGQLPCRSVAHRFRRALRCTHVRRDASLGGPPPCQRLPVAARLPPYSAPETPHGGLLVRPPSLLLRRLSSGGRPARGADVRRYSCSACLSSVAAPCVPPTPTHSPASRPSAHPWLPPRCLGRHPSAPA